MHEYGLLVAFVQQVESEVVEVYLAPAVHVDQVEERDHTLLRPLPDVQVVQEHHERLDSHLV